MNSIFQVLTLAWSLQGGVLPQATAVDATLNMYQHSPVLYAQYGFELFYPVFTGSKADANGIFVGTTLRNTFVHAETFGNFSPVQDTFTASTGLRWNELTIGFDHVCTHSVENFHGGSLLSERLFGSMDNLFVKLSGKI